MHYCTQHKLFIKILQKLEIEMIFFLPVYDIYEKLMDNYKLGAY